MAKLRKELEQVTRTRALHRARRQRAPWPVVALVGYTNAGSPTLFNRLANADVMAENLLFATLDPTMREIDLPGFDKAILSDTVGFISDLPTQLVAAFRATLEEVISADLIIHVRDISHPDSDAQRQDVEQVLSEIGVTGEGSAPFIEAWNKIDLLEDEARERVEAEGKRRDNVVLISAASGAGVENLLSRVADQLREGSKVWKVVLSASDGEAIAWLFANGEVLGEQRRELETEFEVRLSDADWARFQTHYLRVPAELIFGALPKLFIFIDVELAERLFRHLLDEPEPRLEALHRPRSAASQSTPRWRA
jgi:GTP-binding protein HflX